MPITRYYNKKGLVTIPKEQTEKFEILKKELIFWNQKTNLTGIVSPVEIEEKHFLDSLSVCAEIPENTKHLIDIGSGAGFPGFPIAIVCPSIHVTLLEATKKKCEFLEHIKNTLSLENTEIMCARAEEAGRHPDVRGFFDVATARAVSQLSTLAEYALPLLKIKGILIAQKDKTKEDFSKADHALEILGGKIKTIREISETRVLVVLEKIKETPENFPRLPGVASKKPL